MSVFAQRLSANKYYPPAVDLQRHLARNRVLDQMHRAEERRRRIFFIQAQAGQGKTNLASQYLAQSAVPFAWYQLGTEDRDTVFFFSSLLVCLRNALDGFRSPLLEQMLENGELAATDTSRVAEILATDLAAVLPPKFCLVFDDLHLLEGASSSFLFVRALLKTLPWDVRILLLSRRMFPDLVAGMSVEVLGNDDLALTRSEIAELFNRVLKIPLSSDMGDLLFRRTEGWIMGLVLMGQFLGREENGDVADRLDGLNRFQQERAIDYFQEEILAELGPDLKRNLLKLSLLEEVPVALAERIAGDDQVHRGLEQLVRQNLFVRSLVRGKTFLFHHLFRDTLRALAQESLTGDERVGTLTRAADWYLSEGAVEEALWYFAGAEDYASVEQLMRQVGLVLLGKNRTLTLKTILLQIPDEDINQHPWLAYFRGMIEMETAPPQALSYFETARSGFIQKQDALGELLSTAQQVFFHLMVDGRINLAASLLERADELFSLSAGDLDVVPRIQVAHILALGHYFLYADRVRVERYSSQAWQLAVDHKLDNLLAGLVPIRGYQEAVLGNWGGFKAMAEKAFSLLGSPRVNAINKLFLRLLQINQLSLMGDVANYSRQRKVLEQIFGQDLLLMTAIGPLFWLLDIDMAITESRLDDAANFVQLGLNSGYAAGNPHLRSQYLQYQAFLLALEGKKDEAEACADESMRLRSEAGGRLFNAINLMILGATFAQLGDDIRAAELLDRSISHCERIEEKFTRTGAHAFRGLMRLEAGQVEAGQNDIENALRLMKDNGLENFYLATPQILETFFCAAVRLDIEREFVRKLAARKLGIGVLDKGRAIPLLRICTLGPLRVRFGSRAEVREGGWSPAQREFWGHLLAAPGLCISQEQMQFSIWPENSADRLRTNFDTLLLRMRRVLDAVCYPQKAKNYLTMQRKVLCLDNCCLDAAVFADGIKTGLKLVQQKNFWQAGNCLYPALQLWQGGFLSNIPVDDYPVTERRAELERLYFEGALAWMKVLEENGDFEEATGVAIDALKQDPTNHALVKELYELHVRTGDSVRADAVVGHYRKALVREVYSPNEIEEIIDSLWESPS